MEKDGSRMCVALPGVVTEIKDKTAVVDFSGNKVKAAAGLLPVKEGDRVLVHAGCILQIVSQSEAEELEELLRELDGTAGPQDGAAVLQEEAVGRKGVPAGVLEGKEGQQEVTAGTRDGEEL